MDEREPVRHELGTLLASRVELWGPFLPRRFGKPEDLGSLQPGEVAEVGLKFRRKYPDTWETFESQLLEEPEYRSITRRLADIDGRLDLGHELLRASFGERAVPRGLSIQHRGGFKLVDPFVEILSRIALVTAPFINSLVDAGLTHGWKTTPIEVRDRKGASSSRQLLVVSGRVQQHAFRAIARDGSPDPEPAASVAGRGPAIAGLVDGEDDLPTAILLSPEAKAAVVAAGQAGGINFEEIRHISPLVRS